MTHYLVIAVAMAASALPLDAQDFVSTPANRVCASAVPVMVTALPAVRGFAVTVTASGPLVTFQPSASGFHGQASQSCVSLFGTSRTATRMPFVASEVVTVKPFAANVATAVCTTADGDKRDVSVVGAGAVTGAGVAQPASAASKAREYRMADDAPSFTSSATPLASAKMGGVR